MGSVRVSTRAARLVMVIAMTLGGLAPASADQAAFQKGVSAFQAGHYAKALETFEAAKDAGMETPALWLNLGVTAFRLEQESKARIAFERLGQEPGWEPLADYYLGRLAERRNQIGKATAYYRSALQRSDDERLQQRSILALERLGAPTDVPRGRAFLSLSGGYDSNPALLPDAGFADTREAFAEVFGSYRKGVGDGNWHLRGDLYLRQYPANTDLNDAALVAGLSHQWVSFRYRAEAGASAGQFFFGGDAFQTRLQLSGDVARELGNGSRLSLDTELNRLIAATGFEALDGIQARAALRWQGSWHNTYYRLGYRVEWNDRDDVDGSGEQESLSPVRHRIHGTLGQYLGHSAWLEGQVSTENSRYRTRNFSNGDRVRREDDQAELVLRTGRSLSPQWQVYGEYAFRDRSSTLQDFESERHVVQLFIVYRAR